MLNILIISHLFKYINSFQINKNLNNFNKTVDNVKSIMYNIDKEKNLRLKQVHEE